MADPMATLLHDLGIGCLLDSIGRASSFDDVAHNHAEDARVLRAAGVTFAGVPREDVLADALRYGYAWTGVPFPDQWPSVARAVAAEYGRQLRAETESN